ncbi:RHS repeat-associated core domain-containing protein [Saccharophagus degradans]|uniref:RHS repeat domain-containing protein n=1 Tax=Saccharophagus degradans TaxID=86304 RepID=UPI001C0A06E8|nr:RHS repeat-associated core domain-containing protein [Saccharophagus degradans]MBU2986643.1 RHS repeat-associated core domain-containing protein [Saccharophagus degradans]
MKLILNKLNISVSRASKTLLQIILISLSLIMTSAVFAQSEYQQYLKDASVRDNLTDLQRIRSHDLAMLDQGLAGDVVDVGSGKLSFHIPIVSVAGNSALPVNYGVYLNGREGFVDDIPQIHTKVLGEWGIEINGGGPESDAGHIDQTGTYTGMFRYADPRVGERGDFWSLDRCTRRSNFNAIGVKQKNIYASPGTGGGSRLRYTVHYVSPEIHNGPMMLHVGGPSSQMLAVRGNADHLLQNEYNEFGNVKYVTASNWLVMCNNASDYVDTANEKNRGETFIAVSPEGTKYYFDQLFYKDRKQENFETEIIESSGGGLTTFRGKYVFASDMEQKIASLKASKIEDRFGNWVRYEYSDNGEVTKIYSNDNREINITRKYKESASTPDSDVYDRIVVNGRVWKHYHYSRTKHKIILPDNTYWEFDKVHERGDTGSLNATDLNARAVCQNGAYDYSWESSVRHPSGTVVDFEFAPVLQVHAMPNPPVNLPTRSPCKPKYKFTPYSETQHLLPMHGSLGYNIVSKTIRVPSGDSANATYKWKYSYEPMPVHQPTVVANEKWVKVKDPEGVETTYWIDRRYSSSLFGKVIRTEVGDKTEALTYSNSSAFIGSHTFLYEWMNSTDLYRDFLEHKTVSVKGADGSTDVYHTDYEYERDPRSANYSFDRPTKITTYQDPSNARVLEINYKHVLDKWVLLRTESLKLNGKEFDRWEYNANGLTEKYKRFGELVASYSYHEDNALCTLSECKGLLKKQILYPNSNNPSDSENRVTQYSNYKRGIPTSVERADGKNISFVVDNNGWIKSQTDARNISVNYGYNHMGWLTAIVPPSPFAPSIINYDQPTNSYGYVWRKTVKRGSSNQTIYYDSWFRPVKKWDNGTYTYRRYDSSNRLVFESFPTASNSPYGNLGVTSAYDANGRLESVVRDNGDDVSETSYRYLSNNTTEITDPNNNVQRIERSGYANETDGDVIKITNFLEGQDTIYTSLKYDAFGDISTISQWGQSDGYSNIESAYTRKFRYGDKRRLCSKYVPETGGTIYRYNRLGEVTSYEEGHGDITPTTGACDTLLGTKGAVVNLTYTKLGQLDTTTYQDATTTPAITRLYDDNGNLKQVTRANTSWAYKYYDNNSLKAETLTIDGMDFSVKYTRNNLGDVSSIEYPSKNIVSFAPNNKGLPQSVRLIGRSGPALLATSMAYHHNGLLKSFRYGNGALFSQSINDAQLPQTRSVLFNDNREDVLSFEYQYDNNDNLLNINDELQTTPWGDVTNTFDALNRLETSIGQWGNAEYKYDAVGNLRKKVLNGTRNVEISINAKNQVSQAYVAGWKTYVHDQRGNVTNNGRGITFNYDSANQPISMGGNVSASYVYDGNLKRASQNQNGERIYSFYTQGAGLLATFNAQTDTLTEFVRAGGETLARIESDGGDLFVAAENAVPPTKTNAASGDILWRKAYKPYGESLNEPMDASTLDYTGHIRDDSGLVYMQARYYDPVVGRFLSNDPVDYRDVHSFNRYAYAANNPYKFVDPDGQKELPFNSKVDAPRSGYRTNDTPVNTTNLSNPKNQKAFNCHSFAWTGGKGDTGDPNTVPAVPRWINNPSHQMENATKLDPNAPNQEGDVVVYGTDSNNNGSLDKAELAKDDVHSAVVIVVDGEGNTTRVASKEGQYGITDHHPADQNPEYGNFREYYRKD